MQREFKFGDTVKFTTPSGKLVQRLSNSNPEVLKSTSKTK